jgi:hypothetical protein
MTITCSKHAIKRLNERKISFFDLYYAIKSGSKNYLNNKIKYIHNNICVIAYINCLNIYVLTVHYK